MQRSRRWSIATLLAIGLIAVVSSVSAQSMIDLEVDGEFTGTIAGAGSVQARFFATQGAALRLDVRADSGTTLQPMVVFRDGVGADIGGSTQNLRWLPFGNLIHYVTVPADGFYTARISAVSGDGDFWAHLTGNSTAPAVTATLFGTVTDASNAGLINGATVLVDGAAFDTTDANGDYSGLLTPGTYDMTFQAMGYDDRIESVTMADMDVELNVSLTPVVAASVSTETTGDPVFGGMVTAMATIATEPGVTVTSIQWTQTFGTPVMIAGATTDTATVTLGNVADYKDELIHVLSEPPIGPEDLPPNVPVPEGEFPGGLQDRLQVVAASHFALEKAGLVVLEVEVTTDAGVFTDEVEIHTDLPWPVATGLRNVPIGLPVLLHGVEQGSYLWSLSEPAGSLATLTDETTQTPYFTPDVSGLYRLEVMDPVTFGVAATLEVYAGTYRGVIVGQRTDGTPISDTACTFCHNDGLAPDKFTPWEQTGHSQILGDYLDTGTHNRTSCFDCHATGHNTAADSGGMDDASDYQDFLDAGLLNNPGDNWTTMLAQFPEAARLSNVQCESCHGPQNTNAHGFAGPLGDPRISLSADVCGSCHGEPARHARFPQWQLSGHANYELAIDEAGSGNCSRCHTANGFLAWLPVLTGEVPGDPLDNVNVTWTEDESHPQTCVTCHDPHDAGTSSGNNPDVNIRISGDTPPLIAGFQANDVGRGAVCMTCHNSRRGLRNDSTFDALSASEKARAPHGGVQTDVLMGENAFFVEVGAPGGHATTGDTCVDCHMKSTPPPELLSYNSNGANHTFYAELTICSDCHSPFLLAADIQDGVEQLLGQLEEYVLAGHLDLLDEQIALGNTIDFNGDVTVTDVADIDEIVFGSFRGRQAIGVTVSGVDYGFFRLPDIDVVGATTVTLPEVADDVLLKAGWNWNLINYDGSMGIHNPFYSSELLIAARDEMIALLSGGGARRRADSVTGDSDGTRPGPRQRLLRPGSLR